MDVLAQASREASRSNQVFTTLLGISKREIPREGLRIGRGVEGDQHARLAGIFLRA